MGDFLFPYDYIASQDEIDTAKKSYEEGGVPGEKFYGLQLFYSTLLVFSMKPSDISLGIDFLKKLKLLPRYKQKAVYYLAVGYMRLNDIDNALIHIDHALTVIPDNQDYLRLKNHIEDLRLTYYKRCGKVVGALGTAVAVSAIVLAGVMAFRRGSR